MQIDTSTDFQSFDPCIQAITLLERVFLIWFQLSALAVLNPILASRLYVQCVCEYNQLAPFEREWKRPRLMTLWGQISLSSPPCLSPQWNHGGVSVSARAVTLLIAVSQLLLLCFLAEGREGEWKEQRQKRQTQGFFYTWHRGCAEQQHYLMQVESVKQKK